MNDRTAYEGKHLLVIERDGWEFVERKKGKEAAAVLAVTDDDEVILVEQYRRAVDAKVIDWPAGLVGDDGENDPAKTAKKELHEETGYECESVELLAKSPTSPGITSEQVSFFRAQRLRKTGQPEEGIEVHLVPRRYLAEWARNRGSLIDVKIWAGLHFLT